MANREPIAERLHVVLLAAGPSVRFGPPKQLASYGGTSLVRRAAATATGLRGATASIVLGAHSRQVEGELLGIEAHRILNADWRDGLASSIRKGMLSVPPAAMAVLLMPCDMPLVDSQLLEQMVTEWSAERSRIVTCISNRGAGLPAIIPRRYFKALMSIKGDPGINNFFARHKDVSTELVSRGAQADIDTQQDLAALPEVRDSGQ